MASLTSPEDTMRAISASRARAFTSTLRNDVARVSPGPTTVISSESAYWYIA